MHSFLELRKYRGNEKELTRDLFLRLWIPDMFVKRMEKDAMWSMFFRPNAAKVPFVGSYSATTARRINDPKVAVQIHLTSEWTVLVTTAATRTRAVYDRSNEQKQLT